MKPWELIARLQVVSSRLAKEDLLLKADDEFWLGARYAYDALTTFGVKQVPEMSKRKYAVAPIGITWNDFNVLAAQLIKRTLTGNAAREAIVELMNRSFPEQWNNWYRRILRKDFKCGITDTTINKVYRKLHKQDVVKSFSCQLAHDSSGHEEKLVGSKMIDVKMDGVRVLTVVYPNGNVAQYSRNGKELVNFTLIMEQFSSVAKMLKEPFVFDGEVMSATFQDLMKQVRRKSNVKADDAILNLFDMVPLANFLAGEWGMSQKVRRQALETWYKAVWEKLPNVSVIGYEMVNLDDSAGQERFKEINKAAVEGGYEGIMIKDPNAPYQCKRSVAWLKMKPFIEVTLKVVGVEEGTKGTKYEGSLGALVCEGKDSGKKIRVNVGSGLSDELREDIWASPDAAIGQLVEIRADAMTKAQNSDVWSLRFPRFKTFRGLAKGEKL